MSVKVRGRLPQNFVFDMEQVMNKVVMPLITDEMRRDHHFCIDEKGRVQFYPILDTLDPMVFTTTLDALVDYEMESGPEIADALIKVLERALRRVKRAKKKASQS